MALKGVAIHASVNSIGRRDATGAFAPEAIDFARLHGFDVRKFDNSIKSPRARREVVHGILREYSDLDVVAFHCHGLRRSLQTGHDLATVSELASAIAAATGPRVVVVGLYACSTAAKLTIARGGFADALRDELTMKGKLEGHVDAHITPGHATWNAFVQRFDLGEPREEVVGDWLVEPRDPLWPRWRQALRTGDLRHRFPFMTPAQIHAELERR